MKRLRTVCFLVSTIYFQAVGNEALPVLKACGHHDYAPWNWRQGAHIVGVCADAATQIFGAIGFEIDLSYVGPWKRCQQMVASGDVDINICSFKNPQREQYAVFAKHPMASNENALFVNKTGYFDYTQPASLNGKLIGLVRGVSLGHQLDTHLHNNSHVIRSENYRRLFSMLELTRIDGVIIGRQSGYHLLNLYDFSPNIVASPKPLINGNLYFSMSKASPHLDAIYKVGKSLKSPEYQKWLKNALGEYSQRHKAYIKDKCVIKEEC